MTLVAISSYLSPRGISKSREYFKVIGVLFLASMVVGPILGIGAIALYSMGILSAMAFLAVVSWVVQLASLWLALAVIVRRCRDAYGKILMPLGILFGFFLVPFFLLIPLVSLLPENVQIYMEAQTQSHALIGALALSLLTFAPGLIWLGYRPTKTNESIST